MNLFGVVEIPTSKSIDKPGWAYVGESLGPTPGTATTSRKRAARSQPYGSATENTAKQDARILRDLATLDKESHRDVTIPVPVRARDGAGRGTLWFSFPHPASQVVFEVGIFFAPHLAEKRSV